ncbi:MAG: hypothetical protein PHP95_06270 [Desulfuromonadaceae bacterium]|nr:hypothetical protein [Desulfuromonadaceae bacterium]MDD2848045.1 hypothetical protein [Desulfuromonadaceae bacterium]MDD4132114.1 hypothetical protein [Desulfuromonadaceae bacterium]
MKKWIIIVLVIAPFVYANHKKPLFIKHQQQIYQMATNSTETVDEAVYAMPQWEGLEFIDWKFVTATRDKSKQSLVSYGIADYIKVVDQEWAPKAFELTPKEADGETK